MEHLHCPGAFEKAVHHPDFKVATDRAVTKSEVRNNPITQDENTNSTFSAVAVR